MLQSSINSFKDRYKEKSNPFLGTYLLVWIIRNWKLIFSVFNFDKGIKLHDKLIIIQKHLPKDLTELFGNLFINILWALGILVLSYALINLSRFIVYTSEKVIRPFVSKLTDKNSVVLKTTYEKIRVERDELQNEVYGERELKSKMEQQIQVLQRENSSQFSQIKDYKSNIDHLQQTCQKLEDDLFNLKTEIDSENAKKITELEMTIVNLTQEIDTLSSITSTKQSSKNNIAQIIDSLLTDRTKTIRIENELKANGLDTKFIKVAQFIKNKNGFVSLNSDISIFINLHLIDSRQVETKTNTIFSIQYFLTDIGESVFNRLSK
ncbi:MAG: hypothetical protein K0R65_2791 [Crocinitomicaceae bacterium]|jgi:hypothetical protein|nr:hypothetical protein [Crocinitomicaceae bacterium]